MIELGIDEMTMVLRPNEPTMDSMALSDWPAVADQIIAVFLERTGLEAIYGQTQPEARCPKGYTESITLGDHSFYLALAINEHQPLMGCCVRVSAQALAYYVEETGCEAYRLVQDAYSPDDYELRLSRIDLTSDCFDEGIDVSALYCGLTSGSILVMREQVDSRTGEVKMRRAASKLSGYAVSDSVPTFYLGSRKANVDALLRVYDKKREQLETGGNYLSKARACGEWVRFEASLRHGYASQLCEELLSVAGDADYAELIASVFSQRYQFHALTPAGFAPTQWSKKLIAAAGGAPIILRSPSSRDTSLAASLRYLRNGSGLLPLLYKGAAIWDDKAPEKMVDWLLSALNSYEPNSDCRSWVRRNAADYLKQYQTIDEFLSEV